MVLYLTSSQKRFFNRNVRLFIIVIINFYFLFFFRFPFFIFFHRFFSFISFSFVAIWADNTSYSSIDSIKESMRLPAAAADLFKPLHAGWPGRGEKNRSRKQKGKRFPFFNLFSLSLSLSLLLTNRHTSHFLARTCTLTQRLIN